MLHEIKHRYIGAVLYSGEGETLRQVAEEAVKANADLRWADLSEAKDVPSVIGDAHRDIEAVLDATDHAQAVLDAIYAGRVDGSTYRGECSCLLGTIARASNCDVGQLTREKDATSPAEQFFLSIRPGHTPENSAHAALAAAWIELWVAKQTKVTT
jgi:hypothetical protein